MVVVCDAMAQALGYECKITRRPCWRVGMAEANDRHGGPGSVAVPRLGLISRACLIAAMDARMRLVPKDESEVVVVDGAWLFNVLVALRCCTLTRLFLLRSMPAALGGVGALWLQKLIPAVDIFNRTPSLCCLESSKTCNGEALHSAF